MIRLAKSSEINTIYQLWKEYFAHDDFGTIDYFFKNTLEITNLYVLIENDVIISSLYLNRRNIMINNELYKAGFISGVLTLKEYRHKGYMNKIFKYIFDNNLFDIYLLQAYNPQVYFKYGFKQLYTYKKYRFDNVKLSSSFSDNFDIEDLLGVYNKAMSNCNGYVVRDSKYYIDMIREHDVVNSKLLYSKLYCCYVIVDSNDDIIEIMINDCSSINDIFEKGSKSIIVNIDSACNVEGVDYELKYDALIKSDVLDLDLLNNLYMNEYF